MAELDDFDTVTVLLTTATREAVRHHQLAPRHLWL